MATCPSNISPQTPDPIDLFGINDLILCILADLEFSWRTHMLAINHYSILYTVCLFIREVWCAAITNEKFKLLVYNGKQQSLQKFCSSPIQESKCHS